MCRCARGETRRRRVGIGGCIQEEAENLPDTTAMPEGAEYRRKQRLERERGGAGGGGSCLAERSGGAGTLAWGGRAKAGRREERGEAERARESEERGRR